MLFVIVTVIVIVTVFFSNCMMAFLVSLCLYVFLLFFVVFCVDLWIVDLWICIFRCCFKKRLGF
ncbi:hypothetical protein BZA77DRAFT_316037 [Pyronema omphalodes]|nr:hypothetical protein BZA77DRAFT_316037 [Pyronema omphalodes]